MTEIRFKYPSTFHVPWSQGVSRDDKILKSTEHFIGKRVIVSEKMDGECTGLTSEQCHARSLDSIDHVSRHWIKSYWGRIKHEIPDEFHIFGENMYAKHSIYYTDLKSYFYGFSLWNKELCLSWDETLEWFRLLGIVPVPILYDGLYDEKLIRNLWKDENREKTEGYVLRIADAFVYSGFAQNVAKFVRKGHVQTNDNWMHDKIVANRLGTENEEM